MNSFFRLASVTFIAILWTSNTFSMFADGINKQDQYLIKHFIEKLEQNVSIEQIIEEIPIEHINRDSPLNLLKDLLINLKEIDSETAMSNSQSEAQGKDDIIAADSSVFLAKFTQNHEGLNNFLDELEINDYDPKLIKEHILIRVATLNASRFFKLFQLHLRYDNTIMSFASLDLFLIVQFVFNDLHIKLRKVDALKSDYQSRSFLSPIGRPICFSDRNEYHQSTIHNFINFLITL